MRRPKPNDTLSASSSGRERRARRDGSLGLGRVGAVRVDENVLTGLREHDDAVGALANATRRLRECDSLGSGSTVCSEVTDGFSRVLEEIEEPRAVGSAEEAVLVLNVDQLRVARVGERRGAAIGSRSSCDRRATTFDGYSAAFGPPGSSIAITRCAYRKRGRNC